jgi:hypothetical protein
MGLLGDILGASDKSIFKACISIYQKQKKLLPNKPDRDYLKFVPLTKPPFDWQVKPVTDMILTAWSKIGGLAQYFVDNARDQYLWNTRDRNRRLDFVKDYLKKDKDNCFADFFWSGQ